MEINKVQVFVDSKEKYEDVMQVFTQRGYRNIFNCNVYESFGQNIYLFVSYLDYRNIGYNTTPSGGYEEGLRSVTYEDFMKAFAKPAQEHSAEISFEFKKGLTFADVPVGAFYKDAHDYLCMKSDPYSCFRIAKPDGTLHPKLLMRQDQKFKVKKIYQVTKINFD